MDFSDWVVLEYGDVVVGEHNQGVRQQIQRTVHMGANVVRDGHPHKDSAEERNSATIGLVETVEQLGYTPYHISPSKREAEQQGCRKYYHLRDFGVERPPNERGFFDFLKRVIGHKNDITDEHMLVMVDVDYYADINYWASFKRPILCYTFVPETVAGKAHDAMFTIVGDEVQYTVNGGSTWSHPLWNYQNDYMWVPRKPHTWYGKCWASFLSLFNRVPGAEILVIDQMKISKHRRFVTMIPVGTIKWWMDPSKYGMQLKRMKFQDGDYNACRYLTEEPYISISRVGDITSVEVPLKTYEPCLESYRLGKDDYVSNTERKIKSGISAAIVHGYMRAQCKHHTTHIVHMPGELAPHYVALRDDPLLELQKKYARTFASGPLGLASAVYPSEQRENDEECVEQRIVKPNAEAERKLRRQPQARFSAYASEFARIMVPDKIRGTGVPWEAERVALQQPRPTQAVKRRSVKFLVNEHFKVTPFQKREAYPVASAPRNISAVSPLHNLKLSGYTYAFKEDVLKKKKWYMPCLSGRRIAMRGQKWLQAHDVIYETDFSKFDGTVTSWARRVEFSIYKRWVSKPYLNELDKLLNDELHNEVRTKYEVKYQTNGTRLSGSPLTTDGNTILNAFVTYCAQREDGYSPEDITYGLYYGDDSIVPAITSLRTLERTSDFLGFKMTARAVKRGEPITFLRRVFPDWWSTPTSFADLISALGKINSTVDTVSDIDQAGWNKVTGYLVTDAHTPFLSEWCKCYLRNVVAKDRVFDGNVKDLPYWARVPEFLAEPWPQQAGDLVVATIEEMYGFDQSYIAALNAYTGDVMKMPEMLVSIQKPKIKAMVQGAGGRVDRVYDDDISFDTRIDNTNHAKTKIKPRVGSGFKPGNTKEKRSERERVFAARDGNQRDPKGGRQNVGRNLPLHIQRSRDDTSRRGGNYGPKTRRQRPFDEYAFDWVGENRAGWHRADKNASRDAQRRAGDTRHVPKDSGNNNATDKGHVSASHPSDRADKPVKGDRREDDNTVAIDSGVALASDGGVPDGGGAPAGDAKSLSAVGSRDTEYPGATRKDDNVSGRVKQTRMHRDQGKLGENRGRQGIKDPPRRDEANEGPAKTTKSRAPRRDRSPSPSLSAIRKSWGSEAPPRGGTPEWARVRERSRQRRERRTHGGGKTTNATRVGRDHTPTDANERGRSRQRRGRRSDQHETTTRVSERRRPPPGPAMSWQP